METDKATYSKMLLGLKQLAGVPVKVGPYRSLNVADELSAQVTSPAAALRRLWMSCVHGE